MNDVDLRATGGFVPAIASQEAGESVEITLLRDDEQLEIVAEPERWTLAFDEEPKYLEGWRARARRVGCYTYYDTDDLLLDHEHALERESLESELQALRAELERMRTELAETNNHLAELQDRLEPAP